MIAILLAASPDGGAEGAGRALLESCPRTPITGGTRFVCEAGGKPYLVVSVLELQNSTLDQAKATMLEGLGTRDQSALTESKFTHGKRSLDAISVRAPDLASTLLVFPGPTGAIRTASCTSGSTNREVSQCTTTLHFLVDVESGFFANTPVKPTFAGEPKAVPVNCKVTGTERAYQIACAPAAVFTLSALDDEAEAKTYVGRVVSKIVASQPGSTDNGEQPCHVAGEPTKCRLVVGSSLLTRAAIVVRKGKYLAVTCTQEKNYPGLHRACGDVFAP
jgi:hypothetical protein